MRVVVDPAGLVVKYMRRNDEYYCKRQKDVLIVVPHLFGYQKSKTGGKNEQRDQAMMMKTEPVPQGIASDNKCQPDHEVFKSHIVHEVNAQYR